MMEQADVTAVLNSGIFRDNTAKRHHVGKPQRRHDPPRFAFVECADYSLKIQGYIWFKTTNFFSLQDYKNHINMAVLKRFNEEGLSFAYPTSTVFLAK